MAAGPMLAAPALAFAPRRSFPGAAALADYWAMSKPDVNFLIGIATGTAFTIASRAASPSFPWTALGHTVAGTVLVASGAATLNQWMERRFDARMRRTARRPVAAGRIEPARALAAGMLESAAGVVYLAAAVGLLASLLAVVTLLGYLLLYTPAKRVTPLCTLIGAVPGALPALIGWAAARGRLEPEAWALFAIVFLWQFPHFMAIAWMYREDYDRAGYRVLPGGQARTRLVTVQCLLPLLALLPASLLPVATGARSLPYCVGAVVLGLGFGHYGTRFALRPSAPGARQLLVASIVYLPSLFAVMVLF